MPVEPDFPSVPASTTDGVTLFRLLGPFSVWQRGRVLPHVITGPTLNLFAHLLLRPGQRHRREALTEAIWPDSDCRSRAGFNTTLWRLRQFLAPLAGVTLDAAGAQIMLSLQGATSDLMLLEQARERDDPELMRAALALQCGPLLEGEDGAWILAPRERAQALHLSVLSRMMRKSGERGAYDEALLYARSILEIDPFRESVHAEAMWLMVLTGQRVRALQSHHDFLRRLRREMGVGAMSETAALYEFIRDGLEAAPTEAMSSAAGVTPVQAVAASKRNPFSAHAEAISRSQVAGSERPGASGGPGDRAAAYLGYVAAIERARTDVYQALRSLPPPG